MTSPGELTLHLLLPDEACAECVMPASVLQPMFEAIVRRLGHDLRVILNDPREANPA